MALTAALGILALHLLNELIYLTLGWQVADVNPGAMKPLFVLTILSR